MVKKAKTKNSKSSTIENILVVVMFLCTFGSGAMTGYNAGYKAKVQELDSIDYLSYHSPNKHMVFIDKKDVEIIVLVDYKGAKHIYVDDEYINVDEIIAEAHRPTPPVPNGMIENGTLMRCGCCLCH